MRADRRREAPAPGSRLDIDAEGKGVAWGGVRAARTWRLGIAEGTGTWRLTAGATLLSLRRIRGFDAGGRIGFDGTAYSFDLAGSRHDSRREFAGFGTPRTPGHGTTVDIGLAWQAASGRAFASVSLADALSVLRIDGVASHRFVASSSTTSTDADGFVVFQPLVTGRYASRSMRTHLARKASLLAGSTFELPWGTALDGLRVEARLGLKLPAAWAVLRRWLAACRCGLTPRHASARSARASSAAAAGCSCARARPPSAPRARWAGRWG